MQPDHRQLKSLGRREPEAWIAVYRELGGDLFGYVYHLLGGDVPLAEEVTQSAWLTAIERFEQFDPARGSLRNWLFAIARQRVLLHYRQKAGRPRQDASLDRAADAQAAGDRGLATPAEIALQLERRDVVRAAMLCLPEDQRQILQGKYLEGLTVSELAARAGRTEKAVESLLSRARAQLRGLLAHYFEAPQKGACHVDRPQSR